MHVHASMSVKAALRLSEPSIIDKGGVSRQHQCVGWRRGCTFLCILVAHTVSAEACVIFKPCVCFVSRVELIADAASLITNGRQLKKQLPQLAAPTCHLTSSLSFYIFSSSLHSLPTHPLFLFSCAAFFQSVDHASWLFGLIDVFFSPPPFPSRASQHAWLFSKYTYVHAQDIAVFLCKLAIVVCNHSCGRQTTNILCAHLPVHSNSSS